MDFCGYAVDAIQYRYRQGTFFILYTCMLVVPIILLLHVGHGKDFCGCPISQLYYIIIKTFVPVPIILYGHNLCDFFFVFLFCFRFIWFLLLLVVLCFILIVVFAATSCSFVSVVFYFYCIAGLRRNPIWILMQ